MMGTLQCPMAFHPARTFADMEMDTLRQWQSLQKIPDLSPLSFSLGTNFSKTLANTTYCQIGISDLIRRLDCVTAHQQLGCSHNIICRLHPATITHVDTKTYHVVKFVKFTV